MTRRVLIFAILFSMTGAVQAAPCSASFYFEVRRQAQILDSTSGKCTKLTHSTNYSISSLCSICGSTVKRLLAFDKLLRGRQACFVNKSDRTEFANLAAMRSNLQFIQRGCRI